MQYVHVDARDIAAALGTCDIGRLTDRLDSKKVGGHVTAPITNADSMAPHATANDNNANASATGETGPTPRTAA
jgi:hypothetical protein